MIWMGGLWTMVKVGLWMGGSMDGELIEIVVGYVVCSLVHIRDYGLGSGSVFFVFVRFEV